jgi:hypothetical protein
MLRPVSGIERVEVTAAAIARLAGVGRAAVSNWRKRYPDFPEAIGGSTSSPTFDRAEVVAWLTKTGKADQLATAGQTTTGTQRVSDGGWDFDTAFAKALREPDPQAFGKLFPASSSRPGMTRLAARAMRDQSITDLRPRDLLAGAMAALLPRTIAAEPSEVDGGGLDDQASADRGGTDGLDAGQADAIDLPIVLDPACSAATLLMAVAARFGTWVRLAGQEIDEHRARVATFNLSHGGPYEIYAGDSLTDDRLAQYLGKAAAVVCEPPWDQPEWSAGELATDPRWEFGIPAPRDGELAWVQHCYAHLKPRGVAVVAVSTRTCVQPSGEHIRAALVRQGVLEAVITLPSGMTAVPGLPMPQPDICLWVMRRPHASDQAVDPGPVQMIDLSGLGDMADVPQEHAAWQRLFESSDPTIAKAVPRLLILGENASLLPARYITRHAQASARDLARATERLADIYASAGQVLPRYRAPLQAPRLSYVTLAELERVGALTIRSRDATPKEGDVLLRTQGRPPVVATGTATDDTGIAQVVEIDEAKLDPHFVATFLKADVAALPVANTLGAVNRDDLRRCRIPRMPLAEQRRYGDAFRHLSQLDATLQALAATSARIIDQTVYGLTTGVLSPGQAPAPGQASGTIEGETSEL